MKQEASFIFRCFFINERKKYSKKCKWIYASADSSSLVCLSTALHSSLLVVSQLLLPTGSWHCLPYLACCFPPIMLDPQTALCKPTHWEFNKSCKLSWQLLNSVLHLLFSKGCTTRGRNGCSSGQSATVGLEKFQKKFIFQRLPVWIRVLFKFQHWKMQCIARISDLALHNFNRICIGHYIPTLYASPFYSDIKILLNSTRNQGI